MKLRYLTLHKDMDNKYDFPFSTRLQFWNEEGKCWEWVEELEMNESEYDEKEEY